MIYGYKGFCRGGYLVVTEVKALDALELLDSRKVSKLVVIKNYFFG